MHILTTTMRLLILSAFTIVAGCAIQPSQTAQPEPSPAKVKHDEVVVVDSEVQQSFDQALQLLQQKKYDDAISLLKTVIDKEKRLTAPYINLAMAYRLKGDEKAAEANLMKALDIDLGHPVANNVLGLMYRKQGKFADAKKAYSNALVDHPDYLPIIRNLGILCDIYMRDPECALEQFEKYQDQVPDDKTIKIWIADLKARIGG